MFSLVNVFVNRQITLLLPVALFRSLLQLWSALQTSSSSLLEEEQGFKSGSDF